MALANQSAAAPSAANQPTVSTSDLTSLTAAHGITAATAATWYPQLVRTPRLLVPIELDVLMVRDATQSWASTAMTAPPAPTGSSTGPVGGDTLQPPLFANLPQSRPRGAYLQWYLPRAFTAGTSDSVSGKLQFRPIPDRWLVVRVAQGSIADRRGIRGWVLETGGANPQSFDVTTWTESGVAPTVQNPLTALGHGDLAWAGYFDNVVNRLGFADTFLDADKVVGPLTYLVCGWFSDPTADPLGDASIQSVFQYENLLQQLGWAWENNDFPTLIELATSYVSAAWQVGLYSSARSAFVQSNVSSASQAAPPQNQLWWPTACLLHGAEVNISWPQNSDTVEAGGPPQASSIQVALGNTLAETMGAIVANANAKPQEAQVVEALELGVYKELGLPDGRARLDVGLHSASFVSLPGEPSVNEPIQIAPSGPPVAPTSNPATPGAGIFADNAPPSIPHGGPHAISHSAQKAASSGSGSFTVKVGGSLLEQAESTLLNGGLKSAVGNLVADLGASAQDPGGEFTALRPTPRYYLPKDPVILIQGGGRAFVHNSSIHYDGGMLPCRTEPVTELSWRMPGSPTRYGVSGDDILENGIENGSVPRECALLLRETALLDPASAHAIAATQPTLDATTAVANIQVEQTAFQALRRPQTDPGPLLAHSGIQGVLPAPYSVSPPFRPWTPIQLQWSGEFLASPNGENDWSLDQLDFILNSGAPIPANGSGIPVSGRSTLTGGVAQALSSAVANAGQQAASISGTGSVPANQTEAYYSSTAQSLTAQYASMALNTPSDGTGSGAGQPSAWNDISTALSQMDVLSCGLNGLLQQLRGGVVSDPSLPNQMPPGSPSPTNPPQPFVAFRAGFLRLKRLRLVDGFGQYLDLCGSSATQDAQGLLVTPPLQVNGQPPLAGLPPRFSAPARVWFRYLDATDDTVDADYQTSPLCGFCQPNHLEGSLEFFNPDGSGAGSLLPTSVGGCAWQSAPGVPTAAGQDPFTTLTNSHAIALARGMVNWGLADAGQSREPVLSALLRTIDSTLWTVDPFGHQGDDHLALLLGHPVCILRAMLRLDVNDSVSVPDNTVLAVPVRIGDLTQWSDGLLGYFVNDDYSTLHVANAAAPAMARAVGPNQGFLQQINLVPAVLTNFSNDLTATGGSTPVTHPFLDTSGVVWIRPGQTMMLTLLVEPLTSVYATSGFTPRKEIGMRREWVNAGLAAIAPTFRFGPVLVDPQHIRMPLAVDLNGTWVWDYRQAAAAWAAEKAVTNATDDALLGPDPPVANEGWLKLNPVKPQGGAQ